MSERKRSRAEEKHYRNMLIELHDLDRWNQDRKLKEDTLPEDWREIARDAVLVRKKVPVTARFDADVMKFFRAIGPGHQALMNRVLRAWMLAVLSKEITTGEDRDWKGEFL